MQPDIVWTGTLAACHLWFRGPHRLTVESVSSMSHPFTISDLAREFDLTTRAIRFYEDLGLLQPHRTGPGGRNRVYSARDRTRLKLTLRAKRLGLSLVEAKDIIDMYDSPRDTVAQLEKFLQVLSLHQQQLEAQMTDLQANMDELKVHQREARALLAKSHSKAAAKTAAKDYSTQDQKTHAA